MALIAAISTIGGSCNSRGVYSLGGLYLLAWSLLLLALIISLKVILYILLVYPLPY